jgi:hypothetical protein
MKNKIKIIALLATAAWPGFGADRLTLRSVFVKNSEVYVVDTAGASPSQITKDGLRKSLPVWSASGRQIAFVRDSGGEALADIAVISPAGEQLRLISFRRAGSPVTGMRFVEDLEWISEERLAVAGSVNPSTVEYAIVDMTNGTELASYLTDGFTLVGSPDGMHVAYEVYIPHFTPTADRRPRLCIDHECDFATLNSPGYPGAARHVEFATAPVWSASGSTVAFVAEDYHSRRLALIVRPVGGGASEYPLESNSPSAIRLYWAAGSWFVKAKEGDWTLGPGGTALVRAEPDRLPSDISNWVQLRQAETQRLVGLRSRHPAETARSAAGAVASAIPPFY